MMEISSLESLVAKGSSIMESSSEDEVLETFFLIALLSRMQKVRLEWKKLGCSIYTYILPCSADRCEYKVL